MKRIGLLGGMSWESSAEYYRFVNEAVRDRLGGLHSADCVMSSVDFADIEELQRAGAWDEAGALLAREARRSRRRRGAAPALHEHDAQGRRRDQRRRRPVLHIADTTADAVRAAGLHTVGLLATALHDGAGLLRRAAARSPRPRRARARGRGPRDRAPRDLRRAVRRAACWTPRARSTGGSWASWSSRAPRASSSAARRSTCSSGRGTRPCRCSTRRACTPGGGRARAHFFVIVSTSEPSPSRVPSPAHCATA